MTISKQNKKPLTPEQLSDHTWASALTDVLYGKHTLHIPPQEDDEDMVINNAIGQRDATIRLLARELARTDDGKWIYHPLAQQWIEWARTQEDDTDATT